jgi:uncharacterized protein YutE (UPF0331/DUF86 family)
MTPSQLRYRVVAERISWVQEMVRSIRSLSLETYEEFSSDPRNLAAAESYLRRGLEALLDLGRHILAKGFGIGVSEYKEIASELNRVGVITRDEAATMRQLAGYRNRMVHFYHELSNKELYDVCRHDLQDIEALLEALTRWLKNNPDWLDRTL